MCVHPSAAASLVIIHASTRTGGGGRARGALQGDGEAHPPCRCGGVYVGGGGGALEGGFEAG